MKLRTTLSAALIMLSCTIQAADKGSEDSWMEEWEKTMQKIEEETKKDLEQFRFYNGLCSPRGCTLG